MLFLGTEKYPGADFDAFLSDNAGSSNAYTDYMETNYYFECASDSFAEGLDRFSSFFVAPLFNQDLVDREMNAVNSEHSKNLQDDSCRKAQILDFSAIEGCPLRKFGTGNLETLQHPSTREDLIAFYKQNYSANIMKVCVLSHVPLHQIEQTVVELLQKIPNINAETPTYPIQPYPAGNFSALWKYVPIKDSNSVTN